MLLVVHSYPYAAWLIMRLYEEMDHVPLGKGVIFPFASVALQVIRCPVCVRGPPGLSCPFYSDKL